VATVAPLDMPGHSPSPRDSPPRPAIWNKSSNRNRILPRGDRDSCREAPIQSSERTIETSDGLRLFLRCWRPAGPERASVAIVHGYAEHSGRYERFACRFAPLGLALFACDLRGHGRSPGRRGHIHRFKDYLRDVEALVDCARRNAPATPLFLLGHSLGGLIAARYTEDFTPGLAGLILSSPFLQLRMPVPLWKRAAASVLTVLAPAMPMPSDIDLRLLTHDTAIVEETAHDPLSHQWATPRWFTETLGEQPIAIDQAPAIRPPVALLLAGDDRIADIGASEELAARTTAPVFARTYPGMFHELFNERDREIVFQDVEAWIEGRLAKC